MARRKGNKTPVEPVVEEPVIEAAIEALVEETEEKEPEPIPVIAVVTNCGSLRVRRWPDAKEEIITLLNRGDEVELDLDDPVVDGWYKVILPDSNERGFCMKNYLVIKE